jgi:hypothetical protein
MGARADPCAYRLPWCRKNNAVEPIGAAARTGGYRGAGEREFGEIGLDHILIEK